MPHVDLDAARAARLELDPEPKTFTLAGHLYTLPAEPPLALGAMWAKGETIEGLHLLLGDEQFGAFMAGHPSSQDLDALAGAMMEMYGITAGESPASVSSLPKGGSRSRRTSSASTA